MKTTKHGGNIYAFAQDMHIRPSAIIDFSANINPLGLSPKGEKAVLHSQNEWMHYPDPNNEELYSAIETRYHISSEHCVIGNGAAELIYAICRVYPFRKIMVTAPTFSEYALGAKSVGLPVEVIPQDVNKNFAFTVDSITAHSTKDALIFLGNPNNPDGSLITPIQCKALLELIDPTALVVLDESFIDFIGEEASCRSLIQEYKQLVILHSYTKFYAIPGLRLGAAYMSTDWKRKVTPFIPAWSVNRPAQVYSAAALLDDTYITESRQLVQSENARMFALYQTLPACQPIQPSANFMLLHFTDSHIWGTNIVTKLKQRHILIRDCSTYDNLEGIWYRIAIKTPELNSLLFSFFREEADELYLPCSPR